ncbi:MAG: rhomboid family intramembrane serine protease [Alphaproteobacteria bacterium]|nr:rhomboid family intramembrane serine protease [Alphaproteobacteria bacterium]
MRPADDWKKARATAAISIVTAACWLIVTVLGREDWAAVWGGFVPARYWVPDDFTVAPFWLTPLTATLVHGNIFHLVFNLLFLMFCGRRVENVLGPASLVLLYVLGAYAAAGAQFLLDPHGIVFMIGASGAISAVLGAYAMLFGRNRVSFVQGRLAVWINALWLMATWVILQILVGLASLQGDFPFTGAGMAIAVAAHIGGFIVGVLLANPLLLFRWRKA